MLEGTQRVQVPNAITQYNVNVADARSPRLTDSRIAKLICVVRGNEKGIPASPISKWVHQTSRITPCGLAVTRRVLDTTVVRLRGQTA